MRPNRLRIGTVKYPRLIPRDEQCAKELKMRTLTNLYNQRRRGSSWPIAASTKPSSPPTAGLPTSPTTNCWRGLLALNLRRAAAEAND
jgi:hypothetical protein